MDPIKIYKEQQYSIKDRLKAVILLHQGVVKNIHFMLKDQEKKEIYWIKALNILAQLIVSTDTVRGGDAAQAIYYLYEYLYHRLASKKEEASEEVIQFLKQLTETLEQNRRKRK